MTLNIIPLVSKKGNSSWEVVKIGTPKLTFWCCCIREEGCSDDLPDIVEFEFGSQVSMCVALKSVVLFQNKLGVKHDWKNFSV